MLRPGPLDPASRRADATQVHASRSRGPRLLIGVVVTGVGGTGSPRLDDEQIPGTGFGWATGDGGDFGRRDHNHFGRRDGRGPSATALSDLHTRAGNETRALDRDRSPPAHRPRRRRDRGDRGGGGIGEVVTGVGRAGPPRLDDEQVPGTGFGWAIGDGGDFG